MSHALILSIIKNNSNDFSLYEDSQKLLSILFTMYLSYLSTFKYIVEILFNGYKYVFGENHLHAFFIMISFIYILKFIIGFYKLLHLWRKNSTIEENQFDLLREEFDKKINNLSKQVKRLEKKIKQYD
jgi:hypothetical protein